MLSNSEVADLTKGEKEIYVEKLKENNGELTDEQIQDRAAKEKALLRKIDLRMMPLMMLICTFLNSMDTIQR